MGLQVRDRFTACKFVTDGSPRQAKNALPISEASSGCALGSWVMGRRGSHLLFFPKKKIFFKFWILPWSTPLGGTHPRESGRQ